MWELDHKEGWELKNWCFRTVVLEKTLQSPLDIKEIKAVNPKGDQSWISIGKTDAEAEALIPQPSDAMSRLIGKDPTHWKRPWCWEKIEDRRGRGWQRVKWLDGITDSMGMSLSKLQRWWSTGKPGVLQSMRSQRVRHNWVTELNWKNSISSLPVVVVV